MFHKNLRALRFFGTIENNPLNKFKIIILSKHSEFSHIKYHFLKAI